jgi:Flp pilus assembly protein TadG
LNEPFRFCLLQNRTIMATIASAPRQTRRRAAATVELSIVLPLLVFLFVVGMDYARVFQTTVIVANCARNGALWASDPNLAQRSDYETLAQAVQADAADLSEPLTVTSREGEDTSGYGWVEVTVVYPFRTVLTWPGVPSQLQITRTVHMRKVPSDEAP